MQIEKENVKFARDPNLNPALMYMLNDTNYMLMVFLIVWELTNPIALPCKTLHNIMSKDVDSNFSGIVAASNFLLWDGKNYIWLIFMASFLPDYRLS